MHGLPHGAILQQRVPTSALESRRAQARVQIERDSSSCTKMLVFGVLRLRGFVVSETIEKEARSKEGEQTINKRNVPVPGTC